ncbi:putative Zinc metalloproteinase nas-14 [Hypsibius exemplaris]|uniref:Metalloendopeptidase n=1 Tax=Hypsibius exemplaris TaxID=2072580 RepID=A0A9X6NIC4_HYPEX|nr:putative Zinc metalloproteinase nas-14 [Hypsibius exemplaris]
MEDFSSQTCIKFQPLINDPNSILFQATPSRDEDCVSKGIIQHELMHVVGFFHEQSRSDRNDFVDINKNNLDSEVLQKNFLDWSAVEVTAFGFPYDFGSIMHYPKVAFPKDGFSWTIRPKKEWAQYETVMGQRNGLSQIDIGKINAMYKCPERGGAKPNQPLPPPPSLPTRAPIQPTKMSSSSSFNTGPDDGDDYETTTAGPPVRPSVRSTRRTTRPSVPNTELPPDDDGDVEDSETQAPTQRTTRPRRIAQRPPAAATDNGGDTSNGLVAAVTTTTKKPKPCISKTYEGSCDDDDEACAQSCADENLISGKCEPIPKHAKIKACFCRGCAGLVAAVTATTTKPKPCIGNYEGSCIDDDVACAQSCAADNLTGGKCGPYGKSGSIQICYCQGCAGTTSEPTVVEAIATSTASTTFTISGIFGKGVDWAGRVVRKHNRDGKPKVAHSPGGRPRKFGDEVVQCVDELAMNFRTTTSKDIAQASVESKVVRQISSRTIRAVLHGLGFRKVNATKDLLTKQHKQKRIKRCEKHQRKLILKPDLFNSWIISDEFSSELIEQKRRATGAFLD